jgi:DNA-binding Lrp family transcriptional regulator
MSRPPDAYKDQELLDLLRGNARAPLTEIARALGVSRATVQARMERLERDGTIAGYTIRTGDAAELKQLSAVMTIELDVKKQVSIIGALQKSGNIRSCHTISGQFDILILVRADSPTQMDELIDWINGLDGVRRTTSSLLLAKKFER